MGQAILLDHVEDTRIDSTDSRISPLNAAKSVGNGGGLEVSLGQIDGLTNYRRHSVQKEIDALRGERLVGTELGMIQAKEHISGTPDAARLKGGSLTKAFEPTESEKRLHARQELSTMTSEVERCLADLLARREKLQP